MQQRVILFEGDISSVVEYSEKSRRDGIKEFISSEVINSPNGEFLKSFHF